MLKKLIIAILVTSPIFAKTFSLEALYGFGFVNTPTAQGKLNGNAQDGGIRAIFFTDNFTHEIAGRYTFASNVKVNNLASKYNTWEAEYRFGTRMDNDMAKLGMLLGSAYLGLGYQSFMTTVNNIKNTTNYIYLPFGFWGEDDAGANNFKVRYGLNLKAMLFDNSNNGFRWKFLLGGKVYAGAAYSFGNVMDIFAQLFFTYNAPIKNLKIYGIEAGIQF
ncbi:hypothetical protein [Helicobacter sp. MIT 99-5507]|uniref:hypothetical protein n=1 Tax=Helicobacter sp. MIT 99-5507 TaxID=152489 RepID=UPI000E1EBFC0|nr:hypothetical protein [Helicobacter sp. MIT 99-5507]RDU57888.1 hypothetical protein CQA42_03015 [Helicobacter sp. MIT 99-5507]